MKTRAVDARASKKSGKGVEEPSQAVAHIDDGVNREYQKMFSVFDSDSDGLIDKHELFDFLEKSGILLNDARIQQTVDAIRKFSSPKINFADFKATIGENSSLFKNIAQQRLIIPEFQTFCEEIREIFETVRSNRSGKVADYIPELGRVDPEKYALSVTTVSGQRYALGDSQTPFCLQSTSKPITYCLALEEHGREKVHEHVGQEPSGRGFNELSLNHKDLPHNPMINSGGIMSCSLIRSDLNLADRFDYILQAWSKLSGNARLNFNNPVYLSERETADRNFALGYFMREKKTFPAGSDLLQTLEFYFQCCSIEIDVEGLSVVAASLANGGVCPISGEKVFSPTTVQNCLSLMGSCGMYDFSGEFAFSIGLPAKSGVSGAVMVVIPNVMGFAIWSPRLDAQGNSVRGIEFCQHLVEQYNFHIYDSILVDSSKKKDPRLKKNASKIEAVVQLCWAASQGDLFEVQNLISNGANPDGADYDGRTALHLAASEGHEAVVMYLTSKCRNISPVDRWGGTPLSDAKKSGKLEVIRLLEEASLAHLAGKGAGALQI